MKYKELRKVLNTAEAIIEYKSNGDIDCYQALSDNIPDEILQSEVKSISLEEPNIPRIDRIIIRVGNW